MAVSMKKVELLEIQLKEIELATNNFHNTKCIGGGGFGKVYEGALPQFKDRSMVAFKRLNSIHGQGGAEYSKEITFLSRYTHENLISLLGFCKQGKEMILVYEHACHGSLDKHLNSPDLTWKQRLNICLGTAKGLNYLHDPRETGQRLIHCDIKSANILLDDKWNAKVADFGLSKTVPINQHNSIIVTNALGTAGYCDPLFVNTYALTKESDVYSFGVVLFEVLCGSVCFNKNNNGQLEVLVPKWKMSYEEGKLDDIILPDLKQNMDMDSLEKFSVIAYQCLKRSREERPSMSLVVKTLEMALQSQVGFEELRLQELEEFRLLFDNSKEKVKELLSKGFLNNRGTTGYSLNKNEHHIQLTSIKGCLELGYNRKHDQDRYSHDYASSFEVGTYNTRGEAFNTRVRSQFLSPSITYDVNLIFKCPEIFKEESVKQVYISLTYKLNEGEKKLSIVQVGDKREDEWLIARLHQFDTSHQDSIVDLEIDFENHQNCLEIEGIQFQPVPLEINNTEEVEEVDVVDDDDDEKRKYEEIIKSAAPTFPPLLYPSLQQLKLLLSNGVYLLDGNMWFYVNDKGQHCGLISIKQCLIPVAEEDYHYNHNYNSRFRVGTYNTRGNGFKTYVCVKLLSPFVTYTVNLICKCPHVMLREKLGKEPYMSLRYTLNKVKKRISIVDLLEKREDEWLSVRLHHFTTYNHQHDIVGLEIEFDKHPNSLEIEGIQFQPVPLEISQLNRYSLQLPNTPKKKGLKFWKICLPFLACSKEFGATRKKAQASSVEVEKDDDDEKKYQKIVKSAESTSPLFYSSLQQLKLLLSKGVHLNSGNTWFYVNDKGQHCELISIKHCLIPIRGETYEYSSEYNSRFPAGTLIGYACYFKVGVRAQFLTPLTTYMVNLVFKFVDLTEVDPKEAHIGLKYKLQGRTKTLVSHFAHKRELDEWWMVALCQFTSEQGTTTTDLKINFQGISHQYIVVEGIEFLPMELDKEEDQVLEDKNVDDDDHMQMQQPISSSDSDSHSNSYWEQKLPKGYEDIIRMAKDSVPTNTTKRDLYLILSKGFLINDGQEWLSLDKNGRKCLMLSPRVAFVWRTESAFKWQSLTESRFGESMELTSDYFGIEGKIESELLTSKTRYATYLVYKLPAESDQSKYNNPVIVERRDSIVDFDDDDYDNDDYDNDDDLLEEVDNWYMYLVGEPIIPVINVRGKVVVDGITTHNPLNRPKIEGKHLPKQRRDGWMEVQIWEFQTPSTPTTTRTNQNFNIGLLLHLQTFDDFDDYGLEGLHIDDYGLEGLHIQGIEFRPI